jgi:glycine/D-amino acid oxidase-like deaminating enzyme
MTQQPHILVIGAGIIGASIAYHLLRDGARVTILDAGPGGGLATRHSWAWINASWGNPEPYFRLRLRSMREWRRLQAEIPGLAVNWCGGLLWDLPAEKLSDYAQAQAAWGYDIRAVSRAEAQRIEPQLARPPEHAVFAAAEGAVEPLAATAALLQAAIARGAVLLAHHEVSALDISAGRITGVVTEAGRIAADQIVIAAGAASDRLAASAGLTLPMSAPAGLLVVTRPSPMLLKGLVMAPELHVRQRQDGCLIAGSDFGGADPGTAPHEVAERILAALRDLLIAGPDLVFDHYTIGYRPLPADDHPAIGRPTAHDNLYLAVTHSGITLAPALGQFAAQEILAGRRDPLLAPYGLTRFGL